ncbi:hypothetical protein PNOK_0185100 [Pyrrhoderma noxium]|uniref:Uncharacterized protein n=1 Tax=Pyrrhoderma noxium TaxID=2282107 RepID=A0A286UQU0_9AGAM|nr:hypothetical protein PNOK_0185100 [Pyrrhoderma noxium]
MASQRNMYTANNSSTYLPSYNQSSRRDSSSYEDYKPPAEDDIIDSYTTTSIPLPKQTYPSNFSSSFQNDRSGQPPLYPPSGVKPSFQSSWTENSNAGDGGGEAASDCHLNPSKEFTLQGGTKSLLDTILPETLACRLYVLTVLFETIVDIAIEADLYLRIKALDKEQGLSKQRLPVYLAIFCFAHLFQFGMAVDAVHARNTLQFILLTGFNALFLVYAVAQIFEIRNSLLSDNDVEGGISDIPVNVLTTVIPIVISIAEIAYIALGWKIWREFGWKVYKRLGADRQVKRMYAHYQIFVCVMKFDVFFFVGFSVQLVVLVLDKNDWEYYVTCAALPFSLVLLVDGLLAARYENKMMMLTFMLGCGGAMVYFVYKQFRIFQMGSALKGVAGTLSTFAIIAIILLVFTSVMAFLVLRNFGGGLKYHMNKPARSNSLRRAGTKFTHRKNQSFPLSANPNRMSID